MNFEKLDELAKKSWLISSLIALIIVSGVLITIRIIAHKGLGDKGFIFNIVIFIIISLMALNAFIYPSLEYKQWKYSINEDSIELIHGIYFVKSAIIPVVRIQHIKTSQGPINKKLGLSSMEIYTAGGVHKIPNINKEKAEEIAKYLKDKVHIKVKDQCDVI